jgi:hypothetical protein
MTSIFQHSLAASVITAVLANVQTVHAGAGNIDEVAVIVHSVSTSIKAREIRTQAGWDEVPPKRAAPAHSKTVQMGWPIIYTRGTA